MRHIEGTFRGFGNCDLYFQSWHPDRPSSGVVALVHGLGGHSGILRNVVEYLVPQGYEVYAMDLRGHGRSQGQRGYINSWTEFREDLQAFIQRIRQQRAHCPLILWGHSMGGTIALDYALHRPDQLQGLIVSAPALSQIHVPPHKLVVGQLLSQFLPHFRLPAGLANSLADRDRVALAAYLQDPLRHEWGSARLVTEFFRTVNWINYHAAELRVPLLLMHGTADGVTSPVGSRAFFERVVFPDKEHHEYPGAYHDLYDDIARFTMFNDVEVWLDRHLDEAEHCQPYSACLLVHEAPKTASTHLGHSIPSLLDRACLEHPNATAFNQWRSAQTASTESAPAHWQQIANQTLQQQMEATALGFQALGLSQGDRVALLMHSNLDFIVTDLGCLLAHLVDVPIDLTQTIEHMLFAIEDSGARALVVTDLNLLQELAPYLNQLSQLERIVLAETTENWQSASHQIGLPRALHIITLERLQTLGESHRSTEKLTALRSAIQPQDLATIIYIPSPNGELIGVTLTHENISANALATFGELPDLGMGNSETVLAFLPLTHIFARQLLYGHLSYGHSIYFSDSRRLFKHLQEIRPTVFATVPILLEKIHQQLYDRAPKLKSRWSRIGYAWALGLAQRHELSATPTDAIYPQLLKLADRTVYRHWRAIFGGRLKYLLSGGAALPAPIANTLTAAKIPILQGYGLTQTAGVVCFNRPSNNRAGSVGPPIPGIELAIAPDQEILVRGPYITPGYYQNSTATAQLIDPQGWLHTGDYGNISTDGHLQITGLKKPLFKLSTGKYIAPQPIEQRLRESALISHVLLTGSDRPFCAALIFPNFTELRAQTQVESSRTNAELLQDPCIQSWFQTIVDQANCHLPYWSMIKRFRLVDAELSSANGLLNDQQQIHRYRIGLRFPLEIAAIYGDELPQGKPPKPKRAKPELQNFKRKLKRQIPSPDRPEPLTIPTISCPRPTPASCPTIAQSLPPRFTT